MKYLYNFFLTLHSHKSELLFRNKIFKIKINEYVSMPFIVYAVIYECIVFFLNYEYHFAASAILYECQNL